MKKYKLVPISGGALLFNTCNIGNRNSLMKYDETTKLFNAIQGTGNIFNIDEVESIKSFVNFVLPYMYKNENTKEIFGDKAISDIQVINAGAFGATLMLGDYVIKTLKNGTGKLSNTATNELIVNDVIKSLNLPPEINTYYGFMMPLNIYQNANIAKDISNKTTAIKQLNIISDNIDKFDAISMFNNFTNSTTNVANLQKKYFDYMMSSNCHTNKIFGSAITILFLKKANKTLLSLIGQISQMHALEKDIKCKQLLIDMNKALSFLHKNNLIHHDIKPENIMTSDEKNNHFVLIDFGLLSRTIHGLTGNMGGTPIYYEMTLHEQIRSFHYDWQCIFYVVLETLGHAKYNLNKRIEKVQTGWEFYDYENNDETKKMVKIANIKLEFKQETEFEQLKFLKRYVNIYNAMKYIFAKLVELNKYTEPFKNQDLKLIQTDIVPVDIITKIEQNIIDLLTPLQIQNPPKYLPPLFIKK